MQINNLKKTQTLVKYNVVQENGILKKQATLRRSIGVQYSKPKKFPIIITTWVK
jgi:hypothetical protein